MFNEPKKFFTAPLKKYLFNYVSKSKQIRYMKYAFENSFSLFFQF